MTSGIRINGVLTYRVKKNEKPNRYPIFKKTDTENRLLKKRPKNRKPTQNTDTDP